MSKRLLFIVLPTLLLAMMLSACGSQTSWEDEKIAEVSNRIDADNVNTIWTIADGQSSGTGGGKLIRLEIKKQDGTAIDRFDINHEKLLHLIVISKDLSYFNHIHPEYKGNGVFEIQNDFPAGGEYRLIADFKPADGDSMTKMTWAQLDGKTAQPVPVKPDSKLEQVVQGNRVQLTIDRLAANQDTKLQFSIADERTNRPVTDLQPYLGAIGHVVILSEDGERYLHVHAEEGQGSGPDAVFETQFPKSGIYKIWGQFRRNNEVFTSSFVVNVS
ncbi:hypothetical protein E5161_16960 [Cohnella pontilimi]|uniref:Uncharacterized protein n=1 Tax=Cohnella pontilimi TaxID=2564100 RepID=A0A4V5LRW8_9BACL|nr:hypothetical protein [Cohnella pontilimi]TJY40829.1 hypothetical protein E5161_16960 [Cohnella pontilimi]